MLRARWLVLPSGEGLGRSSPAGQTGGHSEIIIPNPSPWGEENRMWWMGWIGLLKEMPYGQKLVGKTHIPWASPTAKNWHLCREGRYGWRGRYTIKRKHMTGVYGSLRNILQMVVPICALSRFL